MTTNLTTDTGKYIGEVAESVALSTLPEADMIGDTQIHRGGEIVWAAATLKEDAVTTAGKQEMATMRWTVIFKNMDGKWLIVHEHTSEPLQ